MPWASASFRKPLLLTVAVSACLLAACRERQRDARPAGRPTQVAGEPIAEGEWELFQMPERASVFTYFHDKYGAEDSPDFWTHDFQGERPDELLRNRTWKSLARIKIEQGLALKEGLLADIGWQAFLDDLKRENKRRSKALETGAALYGPTSFDERTYFQYRHSNMVIHLKEKLAPEGLEPDEARLMRVYDSLKTSRYADNPDFGTYPQQRSILRQRLLDEAYERRIDTLLATAEKDRP